MSFSEETRKKIRRRILLRCSKWEKQDEDHRKVAKAMREHVDDIIAWYEKNRRKMTIEDLKEILTLRLK
jgi:hypothetical protein